MPSPPPSPSPLPSRDRPPSRGSGSPARPSSPSATRTGSARSARPPASLSPGRTRHTMRRATTPATCRTPTRPASDSRSTVQRSFSSDASSRYAAAKPPRANTTSRTMPATGARLTCTSSGERKMDTRVAGPTQRSSTSVIAMTRPSAGAKTAPGRSGAVRSGSRKKPRKARASTASAIAGAHHPTTARIHAAAAGGKMNGQPSRATGIRMPGPLSAPTPAAA